MAVLGGDLTTRLVHHLRCPVCLLVCQPPIYMCSNGHNVCAKCKSKVFECATCHIFLPYVRNLFAEEFYKQITIACRNGHLGCKDRFGFNDIKAHEDVCPFNYKCFYCEFQNGYKDILEHLKNEHKSDIRSSEQVISVSEVTIVDDMESSCIICINTDLVLVSISYLSESKKLVVNVAMSAPNQHGLEDEFSNYSCKFKFHSLDLAEKISYRIRVRRDLAPKEYCVIATDMIEKMVTGDKLSYVFYINSREVSGDSAVSFA